MKKFTCEERFHFIKISVPSYTKEIMESFLSRVFKQKGKISGR